MLLGVWHYLEFIKKFEAMISTSTNKMGPGVWLKSIQHKNRHINAKSFVPFKAICLPYDPH